MAACDSYWRLPSHKHTGCSTMIEKLTSLGYTIKYRYVTADLIEMMRKVDRGDLCYDKCRDEELASFIEDRKVEVAGYKPDKDMALHLMGRKRMLEILGSADDSIAFPKFLELPPELRAKVYDFHLSDMPQDLTTPSQPPLARTCHMMRKEVLPVFYGTKIFKIEFVEKDGKLRCPPTQALWLETMSAEAAAAIRRLRIQQWRLSIKLSKSESETHEVFTDPTQSIMRVASKMQPRMDAIQECLAHIGSGDGQMRLQVKDIFALRRAMEGLGK